MSDPRRLSAWSCPACPITRPLRADPNLTPLLDVVLQLIMFFMMLVHFGTRIEGATQSVRAGAPAALPRSDLALERLVVSIDEQGRLIVDDEAFEGASAARWWTDQARQRRQDQQALGGPGEELPTVVVIRADRRATYGAVRKTMAMVQTLGFARFTLVVIREVLPVSRSHRHPPLAENVPFPVTPMLDMAFQLLAFFGADVPAAFERDAHRPLPALCALGVAEAG